MNELLRKYIAGDASEEEIQKVMHWLRADERNLREYKRERKLYDLTLWQSEAVWGKEPERRTKKRPLMLVLRVAAVVALVLSAAHLYHSYQLQDEDEKMQTVLVPAGQHAELYLADGTHVWLNSGSRFTFPGQFARQTRRVELDGEGYFKVSSRTNHPFIVGTHRCDIRVLGTEFNVLAYRADSVWETALLEGSVEILQKEKNVPLMRLEPGSMAKLQNEQLTKEKIGTMDAFRWREGLICFDNAPLRDMIEKLRLYYDVNFVVNNRQILNACYTGKFRVNDGIDHVMRVLSLSKRFTYLKDEEKNTIIID